MALHQFCAVLFVILAAASASPSPAWVNSPLEATVQEMRSLCASDDTIACIKYKFMSFLDTVFKKDSYKLSENVEIVRNEYRANEVDARSEKTLEDNVQDYLQSHDVTIKLPGVGSTVTLGSRNIDNDELDIKLKFSESSDVSEAKGKKSKLKKIIVPILVFVLLKAITLIPLALGVLGLKAWNALQLSFFSFVISVALAIFQLCKKIAADNAHPPIAAHGPWEAAAYSSHYARSFDEAAPVQQMPSDGAQQMAYNAYY